MTEDNNKMELDRDVQSVIATFLTPYWKEVITGRWDEIPPPYAYSSAIICNSIPMIEWLRDGPRLPWCYFEIKLMAEYNKDMLWQILTKSDAPKGYNHLASVFAKQNDVQSLQRLETLGNYKFEPWAITQAILTNSLSAIRWLRDPIRINNVGYEARFLPRDLENNIGKYGNIEIFKYFYDEEKNHTISIMAILVEAKARLDEDPSRLPLIKYIEDRFLLTAPTSEIEKQKQKNSHHQILLDNFKEPMIHDCMELRYGDQIAYQIAENKDNYLKGNFAFHKLIMANNLNTIKQVYTMFDGNPPGWNGLCYESAHLDDCVDVIRWLDEVNCPKN